MDAADRRVAGIGQGWPTAFSCDSTKRRAFLPIVLDRIAKRKNSAVLGSVSVLANRVPKQITCQFT